MSKRVVFHIGPPKTGSSAIQHFLHQHRSELASLGVLYPNHTIDENGISSGNARVVCSADKRGRLILDAKKLAHTLEKFHNEKHYHTLLFSSESFFRILEDVIQQVPSVEIVCFIRNPVEFQLSIYNQSVKRHGNDKPFIPRTTLNLGQWEKLLAASGQLPPALFHCYAYKFPDDGDSIVGDLLKVLNIEEDIRVSSASVNVSYSFAALELKRRLNQFPIASLQNELDTYLQATSAKGKRYRLIDDEALMACQHQLDAAMGRFHSLLPEFEWKHISQAQAQLAALPFVDQAHSQDKVTDLVMQLRKERGSLYRALANVIEQADNSSADDFISSLFKLSPAARLAGKLSLWRRSMLVRVKNRLAQCDKVSSETTCGFGAIRCTNVDIIVQAKGSNPAVIKGGLRGEALPECAKQYRHPPLRQTGGKAYSATDVSYLRAYKARLKNKRGVYYYGGPVFNNFGHFLAESIHRLGALGDAQQLDNIEKVIFLPQRYSWKKGRPTAVLPPHFYAVLAYLGVAKKNILLPTKSFTAANLWISPQQSVFRARSAISESYRQFLLAREKAAGITIAPDKPQKIYVSRTSYLLRGAYAGESVVESFLEKQGFFILKPETLSLKEQLAYYKSAQLLIFAEGSALHVLELLGQIPAKVMIIQRRKDTEKMFFPLLKNRCENVLSFADLYELPSMFIPYNMPAHGSALSVLDSEKLATFLKVHADCPSFDTTLFKQQVSKDIGYYHQTYRTKVLQCRPAVLTQFQKRVDTLVDDGILDAPPNYGV